MIAFLLLVFVVVSLIVAFSVFTYLFYSKIDENKRNVDDVKKTIADLARDVDIALGNLRYDPNNVTSISKNNETSQFSLRSNRVNELRLNDNGSVKYDGLTNTMTINNTIGNSSILLGGNSITMTPNVTIGNKFQLRPNNTGIQICDITNNQCSNIVTSRPPAPAS